MYYRHEYVMIFLNSDKTLQLLLHVFMLRIQPTFPSLIFQLQYGIDLYSGSGMNKKCYILIVTLPLVMNR